MVTLKQIDEHLKQYEDAMVKDICTLVRIKSVQEEALENMPFGRGPTMCLLEALAMSKKLGFRTVNLDNKVGYAEIGEGEEIIGLMGHLDVVPEGEDWDTPPYEPTIKDGKIYGRGVSDNKSPVVCSMYALKTLVDFKVPFNKRIRLIYGINEETGFECINHYIAKEGPVTIGFTPDGSFPGIHGEKGIFQADIVAKSILHKGESKLLSLQGGLAYNSAADRAKALVQTNNKKQFQAAIAKQLDQHGLKYSMDETKEGVIIEVKGVSSHASAPESGVNAVSHLLVALHQAGVQNSFVDEFVALFGLNYSGELLGVACHDRYGKLTMNIGICHVDQTSGRFTIDIRYPISKTYEEITASLSQGLAKSNFELKEQSHKGPIYFEVEAPLIQTLLKCYQEVTQDFVNQPFTIGGGTYARAMPNIIAFGGGFPGVKTNAHTANENVSIENIFLQTRVYALAILRLLAI